MTNKKRILIIGINSYPEPTGIGRYTGEMLDWLIEHDHNVTIVTAFPYYPQWRIQEPYSGNFYKKEVSADGKLTVYRCPLYVPSNPTGLKRLLLEASFYFFAFFIIVRLLFKRAYDITLAVAPPFHLGTLALFYSLFKKTHTIYHIQDLQIDVAKELGILKQKWMFSTLFALEKIILKRVDTLSTISNGIRGKIYEKLKRSVVVFPNWVDIENFYPISNRDDLKIHWGFSPADKIVMYSGSIGEKQGLDGMLNVAEMLKETDIKFVICGVGPFTEKLMKRAERLDLQNLHFFPLQSYKVFNGFLNIGDVHLVLQKADASDLMMPSKLSTILSIGGLALVTAKPKTTLYEMVLENDIGIVVEPENDVVLRDAILRCCSIDYTDKKINARKYAEANLNRNKVLREMFNQF